MDQEVFVAVTKFELYYELNNIVINYNAQHYRRDVYRNILYVYRALRLHGTFSVKRIIMITITGR